MLAHTIELKNKWDHRKEKTALRLTSRGMISPAATSRKQNPLPADQIHGQESFGASNTMRDRKLSESITGRKTHSMAFGVLVFFVLFAFSFGPVPVSANDHIRTHGGEEPREYVKAKYHYAERGRKLKGEGNELTGQTAAWLLVGANLTIMISILIRGMNRYFALGPGTKDRIRRFNRFQKNHLMRFHYLLNPVALCIALVHFLLSSCGRSSIPEWGFVFALVTAFLGFMVKFKITPKWSRPVIYRIHTSPVVFSALILVLLVGHLIVA